MASVSLPALRRNLLLLAFAFAAATLAFGTVMLTSPPTSKAAVATLTDDGVIPPATNCEVLPVGDADSCIVYR